MALSLAAALLSLAAAQAAPAPGGGAAANGADATTGQAPAARDAGFTAPASMNVRIPGTRNSPADTTTAGLDLALASQLLTQTISATGAATQVETGIQVAPTVAVGVTIPRFGFALGYNPQLYLVSITQGPFEVLHRGWILMEYRASPNWRLYFAQRLTYGTNNLSTPVTGNGGGNAGQQPPTLNPAALTSLEYLNNETSVGVAGRLARRLRLSLVAAYLNSGGIGTAAQAVMPHQSGPRAEATLDWNVTSVSTLGTSIAAQANFFPLIYASTSTSTAPVAGPGRQIYVSSVTETWRVQLSRQTAAWLIGGASVANTDAVTGFAYKRLAPIAGAGLESGTRSRQSVRAFLQLLLAPYVDPYLAIEYQRLTANASITWHLSTEWILGVSATAAYVPYNNQAAAATLAADKYGTAGPTLSYTPSKALAFTAGGYWQWQLANQALSANFNQWGVYFSVTVSDFEHI